MKHKKSKQNSFDLSLYLSHNALKQIARREGKSIEQIRKHIQIAMMSGLLSDDTNVQEKWTRIPHAGEMPSPEEVIAYYANKLSSEDK
ncbi:hypothetical protein [Oscillibacter sp. GMB15532]|uniref:hypothetical protein n=1 Tax=Oscillibacter sp. GMB15532 TaxID=3230022 RepID=UPI0034DFB63C